MQKKKKRIVSCDQILFLFEENVHDLHGLFRQIK